MPKIILLTIDLEEFNLPLDFDEKIKKEEMFSISLNGLKVLRGILKKLKIKVTFFVTSSFGEKFPKEIRKLLKEEHEIALHNISQSYHYLKRKNISEKKKLLERMSGEEIIGYREHLFRNLPPFVFLKENGFVYDSSIHPTYIPTRYNNLAYPRHAFQIKGLWEIPISVTPFIRLPFSFFWFRNFNLGLIKMFTILSNNRGPITMYFHPWEFDDNLEKYKIPILLRRKTGKCFFRKFEVYLKWLSAQGFQFITMKEYISSLSS